MKFRRLIAFPVLLALTGAGVADAVIFLETGDPQRNSSTPGDNSGWQYEGRFGGFLGVPIAPNFFITAKHIGGAVGDVFDFHGDPYVTIAVHLSPTTDLAIWEVDHAKPFPTCAPLSSGLVDIGAVAAVFGRGTQRGAEVVVSGESKGWNWGASDGVKRWGSNTVAGVIGGGEGVGELLQCDFDNPGLANECHLSVGDSGGGLFVLEAGLWRLAGIHYAVDGPFRTVPAGTPFNAALYDAGGLEYEDPPGWTAVEEGAQNIASSFYSTRISASLGWISGIAPEVGSLAGESFGAWQRLYFSPAQIAAAMVSGPLADLDGDGIENLLEFALNLDPTFSERAIMPVWNGLRGLPLVRLETVGDDERLTIEYVRRSAASGSGLSYIPEFSSNLVDWQAVGTETVDPLNPRWERVKIEDSLTTGDSGTRFARLRVSLAE
jgi:hypothetical protein